MKIACFKQSALHNKNAQHGASLLEAVAYLGIASLVLVGAVSLVSGAFNAAETNRASEEFVALRTASKKLFSGQIYPANMVPVLIAAKGVPGTLTVNGTGATATISNGFGGAVTVAGTAGTPPNTFTISYANVPPEVCIGIISGASGWTAVRVGTTNVTLPTNASAAQTACGTAATTLAMTSS